MGQRIWGAILLKFAVASLAVGVQRAAQGAEAPLLTPAISGEVLPSASAVPEFAGRESNGLARRLIYGSKRRKPKMAGVPSGTLALVPPEPGGGQMAGVPAPVSAAIQQAEAAAMPATGQLPQSGVLASAEGVGGAQREALSSARQEAVSGAQAGMEPDGVDEDMLEPARTVKPPPPAPAEDEEEKEPSRKYQLAPIPIRGVASLGLTFERGSIKQPGLNTNVDRLTNTEAVGVQAMTFVLKPWIASVRAGGGVTSNGSKAGGRSTTWNGNIGLNLFNRSRFPFSASYSVSDSRSKGGKVSAVSAQSDFGVVTKTLSMNQSYRPRTGFSLYALNYNARTSNYTVTKDQDRSSRWAGQYSTRLGANDDQPFRLAVSRQSASRRDYGNEVATIDTAQLQHGYMPRDSLLTLNTTADYSLNKLPATAGGKLIARNLRVETVGSWEPEALDNPLYVTGRARAIVLQTGQEGSLRKSRSLGVNLNATYNAWRYLRLSAGASANMAKSGTGAVQKQFAMNGVATYRPPAIKIGEEKDINYAWGANGRVELVRSGAGKLGKRATGGANHSFSKSFATTLFGKNSSISTGAGQSVSLSGGDGTGFGGSLNNNARIGWSPIQERSKLPKLSKLGLKKTQSGGMYSLVNSLFVSVSDSISFGRSRGHVQRMQFGGNLMGQSGYQASGYGAQANVSVQAERHINGPSTQAVSAGASWAYSTGYSYKYKAKNLMEVRGLTYELLFGANVGISLSTAQQEYKPNIWYGRTNKNPYSVTLTQTLTYNVGKNQAMLLGYLGDEYGKRRVALFMQLRAWRNFGN